MKLHFLFLLCALCATQFSFAQDSLQVTFSEEQDTLVKQHFVDRFENVFMTKVPTRNMFKIDISRSELSGRGFYAGYEFKILPALSLEAGVYAQTSQFNAQFLRDFLPYEIRYATFWTRARARYYYNMNKRIRSGANANNFSGAYAGFNFDQSFRVRNRYGYLNKTIGRVGLLWGYQGRLFNHGHFDFNVGLFNKESSFDEFYYPIPGFFKPKNFILSTQTNIGLAFGDWKRNRKIPLCEMLTCDERLSGHFKIQLPDISIGLKNQKIRLAGAYEQKLGKSIFSLEGQLNASYRNSDVRANAEGSIGAQVSLRAYLLQNLLIRKGWGGQNLSGLYAELRNSYDIRFVESRPNQLLGEVRPAQRFSGQTIATNLHAGYQQRMFSKFYIDASIGYGANWLTKSKDYTLFDLALTPYLLTDLKIGFTF